MSKVLKNVSVHANPQNVRDDARQVQNNAGGYVFTVSDAQRFERFLILGTDSGTYYVNKKDLTNQNVDFVRKYIADNPVSAIKQIVEISDQGRAKSNSGALFSLALAMNTKGVSRRLAQDALLKVARTSTHLFEYVQYLDNLGGWGRSKTESVKLWYLDKPNHKLAYQVTKYRQRDGWTHRDVLRLAHPKGLDSDIVNFVLGKPHNSSEKIIEGFEKAQRATSTSELIKLVHEYKLAWEMIPTDFHKDLAVWRAFFEADSLGHTALLRNVTRIARLGGFDDLRFAAEYADRLSDQDRIMKGRVHPINFLVAANIYANGQPERNGWGRKKDWTNNSKIATALDNGYYRAFKAVEPANKRTLVAVDVSGSMSSPALGIDLSCAQVSAAIAMQMVRTEPYSEIRGFTSSDSYGYSSESLLTDLGISDNTTLSEAMHKVRKNNFGGTDCSLPMQWALQNSVEIDTFVVITDNETWAGAIKPHQALKQYRKETGIDARLAVFGVAASSFTIADPDDSGMMDFAGFDSNAPKVLADFSAGRM